MRAISRGSRRAAPTPPEHASVTIASRRDASHPRINRDMSQEFVRPCTVERAQ